MLMNNNKKICAMCRKKFDRDELVKGRFYLMCPECKEKEQRHIQNARSEFGVFV